MTEISNTGEAFQPQIGGRPHLIGPDIYPAYVLVVKIVLAALAGSAIVVGVTAAVLPTGVPGFDLGKALALAWNGSFAGVGAVTVVFALIERAPAARAKILTHWGRLRLPSIRRRPTGAVGHMAAIAANALFVLLWAGALRPWVPLADGASLSLAAAPVWQALYWPIGGLIGGAMIVHGLRLLRMGGPRLGDSLDLVLWLAVLTLAGASLSARRWVEVSGVGFSQGALLKIDHSVNIASEVALIAIVCVAALAAGADLLRLADRATFKPPR